MTTIADDPAASLIDPPKTMAAAVSYLRVSTREQAEKGGTDEGFSIPAQREATRRKAEQLGAGIVEEFVDAGASAKSSDRPELMRMIQYVKANKVAYCIVHKVDRLARNRADDVSIHLALQQCGVMLVSASENIDETPSGMLLHGIMSTIAEFYSRNLATEVSKGMTQKAIGGGTNGRAPVGYLNVRKRDELGREVRTIELDPERAPMIEWAFKAYASGNWSVSQLHDELTSRGLRSLPTPKRPAKPLAVSTIHRLLTNPYYKGDVIYRGTRYKGNHPALVPAEVWYQVQSVLTAHQCAVEATQVHGHYLKGAIHCGQCGSRLIVSNAKNRHGNVYCYFVCSGRHSKRTDCTRQAMLIEDVEKLVEDYYTRVQITPAQQDALAGMLHHEFDRLMAAETEELERLTTNRDRLEGEQDRLMQAHYADAIPLSVLKREQDRIVAELDQVTRRIDAHFGDYAEARAHLDDALGLLANCADIYTRCDDTNRRLCNQAFFTKVFIDEDNELRVEHNRPFEMLLDPQVNANALTWAADANKARTSASVSVGKGSSLVRGVDLRGLEPLTPCMPCQLRFRVDLVKPRPAGTLALPGDAAALREWVDPETGAAMIQDPHAQTLTAIAGITHPAFVLLDSGEQERRVAGWGRVLATVCRSGRIARVQISERTAPSSGSGLAEWWARHGVDDDSWPAVTYKELIERAGPAGERHETTIALALDMRVAARQIRAAGGGMKGAASVLRREMTTFVAALQAADLTPTGWLSPGDVAVVLRSAYDPAAAPALERHGDIGRSLATAGPIAVSETWERLHSDSAHHAVLWISEWPTSQVYPGFLSPLLLTSGIQRTFTLTCTPVRADLAARDIRRKKVGLLSDAAQRAKVGQIEDAARTAEYNDVVQQESDLTAGHGVLRFTGLVAVSAPTVDELDAAVAAIEQAAVQVACETRRLVGQQAQAFTVAALPLCRTV